MLTQADGKNYIRDRAESIRLEQVTQETFEKMEAFWNKCRAKNPWGIYSRVFDPLMCTSYEELFSFIFCHPYAYEFAVYNPDSGKWMRRYNTEVSQEDLALFMQLASKNPLKKCYLEIKFRKKSNSRRETWAVIGFTEYKNRIIGYEVRVPVDYYSLFNIHINNVPPRCHYNNGLWIPEEQEQKIFLA